MITFTQRADGINVIAIANSAAKAEISLYGAQLLSFTPKGQKDVLFMSGKSLFSVGKAIRGGIPICFPWFGPNAKDASLPPHGFARLCQWTLASMEESPDLTTICLETSDTPDTRKHWPNAFRLSLKIAVGARLEMTLTTFNPGKKAIIISDAFHTYFSVKSVKAVSVGGLDKLSYIDRVGERATRTQKGPVLVSGETDRVYLGAKSVRISDPGFKRTIKIERKSLPDVVVWNPWIDRAKAMTDFADEEYKGMICVEAASVFDNAITIQPGKSSVQKMSISSAMLK